MPKPIKIAIADDHLIFREGLRELLRLEPDFHVVAEAGNGREVLEVLQKHRPDILLLDLKMPGLDGLAVLRTLQAQKTKTKVIVLTAIDELSSNVQAMKLGASGPVLKQHPTDSLVEAIRKVYGGEIELHARTLSAVAEELASSAKMEPKPHEEPALSRQERQIVVLVAQGLKNREIAAKLFISEKTVKGHVHNIFGKLGVSDRLEIVLYVIHKNIKLT